MSKMLTGKNDEAFSLQTLLLAGSFKSDTILLLDDKKRVQALLRFNGTRVIETEKYNERFPGSRRHLAEFTVLDESSQTHRQGDTWELEIGADTLTVEQFAFIPETIFPISDSGES